MLRYPTSRHAFPQPPFRPRYLSPLLSCPSVRFFKLHGDRAVATQCSTQIGLSKGSSPFAQLELWIGAGYGLSGGFPFPGSIYGHIYSHETIAESGQPGGSIRAHAFFPYRLLPQRLRILQ